MEIWVLIAIVFGIILGAGFVLIAGCFIMGDLINLFFSEVFGVKRRRR